MEVGVLRTNPAAAAVTNGRPAAAASGSGAPGSDRRDGGVLDVLGTDVSLTDSEMASDGGGSGDEREGGAAGGAVGEAGEVGG